MVSSVMIKRTVFQKAAVAEKIYEKKKKKKEEDFIAWSKLNVRVCEDFIINRVACCNCTE